MRLRAAALLLSALCACSGRAAERPRLASPGKPAPEIFLPKLLNSPLKSVDGWAALGGRAAVIEFWSTWDDGSPASLARLDELAARFEGEPVVFIAVTDESERAVAAFMAGRPARYWLAPESGAAIFKAFRVYARPHTVLVGRDGLVAESPGPGALSDGQLRGLLSGRPQPAAPGAAGPAALAEFYLAESAPGGGAAEAGPDALTASGLKLKYALDYIFGPSDKIEVSSAAARAMNAYYDMRLRFPQGRGQALRREFFLKGLDTALGLRVRQAERSAEVYVLRRAPGGPLNMKERGEPGPARYEGRTFVAEGAGTGALCAALREQLGDLVLDETGLKGSYAYSFDFADADKRSVTARLASQLGLRLERRARKVRVLEVTRPEP